MPPVSERLRAVAGSDQGSLEEVPYAVLLAALAVARRDCVVVLERRRTEKRIAFLGGVPADCRSNLLHETFGRFLVAQGKVSEEAFALVQARSSASGVRFGEVLVERGLLSADEVARQLQASLARKLLDAFTWRDGRYRILPGPPAGLAPPKLHVGQLILTGVSRFAPQAAVDAAVGNLVGKRLALAADAPFPVSELRLTEAQARLAAALESRPRIDELATSAGLAFEEITRLLYALWLLGTVVPAEHAGTGSMRPAPAPQAPPAPRASAAATPAPVTPAPAPPPNRRDEMLRAFESLRARDPSTRSAWTRARKSPPRSRASSPAPAPGPPGSSRTRRTPRRRRRSSPAPRGPTPASPTPTPVRPCSRRGVRSSRRRPRARSSPSGPTSSIPRRSTAREWSTSRPAGTRRRSRSSSSPPTATRRTARTPRRARGAAI